MDAESNFQSVPVNPTSVVSNIFFFKTTFYLFIYLLLGFYKLFKMQYYYLYYYITIS